MAARKATATLLAFSRTCTPGLTSTHQLKRKKIRKTIHCMVKFTPTVILPGCHRVDWKKCSALQRTLDRMTFRSLWWPPLLYTPGQPDFPRTEFRVLVCYIQLQPEGRLSFYDMIPAQAFGKHSQGPPGQTHDSAVSTGEDSPPSQALSESSSLPALGRFRMQRQ